MNYKFKFFDTLIFVFKIILSEMKLALLFNLAYTIVSASIPLLILQITKKIMDILELKTNNKLNILFLLLITFIIIYIIELLLNNLNTCIIYLNDLKFSVRFDIFVFQKLKNINIDYYDHADFNELCDKIYAGDNTNLSAFVNYIFGILQATFTIFSYICSLFFIDIPIYQKMVILFSTVIAFLYRRYFFKKQDQMTTQSFEESNLPNRKASTFTGLFFDSNIQNELKIYNIQDYFINIIKNYNSKIFYINKFYQYKIHNLNRIGAMGSIIIQKLIYIIFLFEIYKGFITYGEFVLIIGILEGLFSEIVSINTDFSSLWEGLYYIKYIKQFYKLKEDIVLNTEKENIVIKEIHTIEFENVYFKYAKSSDYVLSGLSFKIYQGQTIGIIGLNGSGKTTILKLLMRFYDPEKGKILINGIDIKKYHIQSLYNKFSVVFQDFCKYALSIKEFIMLDDKDTKSNRDKLKKVLKEAGLDDFICTLPNGYNTILTKGFSKDSVDLSIGQWQKLSLARAYYKDSEVLILDEPSASLDAEAEKNVFHFIEQSMKNKTTIFISHNLSNTRFCDNILLIKKGKVIAQGDHKKLFNQSDFYRELYNSQASRFQ